MFFVAIKLPVKPCTLYISQRLIKYNALAAINNSLRRNSYSIQQCSISDLRHFLYKSRSIAQYTSPELEAPYHTQVKNMTELLFTSLIPYCAY